MHLLNFARVQCTRQQVRTCKYYAEALNYDSKMHLRAISNAADLAIHARISMRWVMRKDARTLYINITVIQ